MQFPSWREKVRQFFEPYDKKNKNKKVETQKAEPGSTMTQNKGDDIYKDGTIMLFPTNPSSTSEWYLTRESNPNSIPTFSTHIHNNYNNKIVRKTEGNQSYWNIKSGIITYRSNNEKGRTCRLNMFPSTKRQVNDWHSAIKQGYIGNSRDLKNQEITFVGRPHKTVHNIWKLVSRTAEAIIIAMLLIKLHVLECLFLTLVQDIQLGVQKS
jgi:hypothetical protein